MKLALAPVLIAVACLFAAVFGALHNQVSYTVGPVYFHEFKFAQFRIAPEFHNRIGAAIVGVRASWWMGLVIGIPVVLVALFASSVRDFAAVFLKAVVITFMITSLVACAALITGHLAVDADSLPDAMRRNGISNQVGFAHAAIMHDASYIGGLIGMICSLIYAGIAAFRSRRR